MSWDFGAVYLTLPHRCSYCEAAPAAADGYCSSECRDRHIAADLAWRTAG